MNYREHFIPRGDYQIYAREYAGEEPAIVLMHGFPDNLHLYDRLVPYLSPPRRLVTFDFLGWGASDKPARYSYTAAHQEGELAAVIQNLALQPVVLVGHDASGPPAIDWALKHSERVAGLVLLNTFYGEMPTLRPPEAIFLFSNPFIRGIARPVSQMFNNLIFSSEKCFGGRWENSSGTPTSGRRFYRYFIGNSKQPPALIRLFFP